MILKLVVLFNKIEIYEIDKICEELIIILLFVFFLQMRRNSDDTAYASANIYNRNQNVYSESGYSCCSSNNDCQGCAGT